MGGTSTSDSAARCDTTTSAKRRSTPFARSMVSSASTTESVLTDEPIPSDVADRIKKKAFQRAAIINDSLIEVTSVGHTVYLDGKADSWVARQSAEETAWNAPGVDMVVDRLEVA